MAASRGGSKNNFSTVDFFLHLQTWRNPNPKKPSAFV